MMFRRLLSLALSVALLQSSAAPAFSQYNTGAARGQAVTPVVLPAFQGAPQIGLPQGVSLDLQGFDAAGLELDLSVEKGQTLLEIPGVLAPEAQALAGRDLAPSAEIAASLDAQAAALPGVSAVAQGKRGTALSGLSGLQRGLSLSDLDGIFDGFRRGEGAAVETAPALAANREDRAERRARQLAERKAAKKARVAKLQVNLLPEETQPKTTLREKVQAFSSKFDVVLRAAVFSMFVPAAAEILFGGFGQVFGSPMKMLLESGSPLFSVGMVVIGGLTTVASIAFFFRNATFAKTLSPARRAAIFGLAAVLVTLTGVSSAFNTQAYLQAGAVGFALFTTFFNAAGEEVLFRGGVFNWLKKRFTGKYGVFAAMTLSSLAFAAFHIPFWGLIPSAFAFHFIEGMVFAHVYHKTKSLGAAAWGHALVNYFGYGFFYPPALLSLLAVGALGLGLIALGWRKFYPQTFKPWRLALMGILVAAMPAYVNIAQAGGAVSVTDVLFLVAVAGAMISAFWDFFAAVFGALRSLFTRKKA